jgi:hypothetical protein
MNEQSKIETIKKPDKKENQETQQKIESSEDLSKQILAESEKEADSFKSEEAEDLAQAEARAEKDGLAIDFEDKKALQELNAEADLAKKELAIEIGDGNDNEMNAEVILREIKEFLEKSDNSFESGEAEKISENFLKPYREGKASFQKLFENKKTAPFAAEALRMVFILQDEKKQSGKKQDDIEFIFNDLVNSRVAIDEQLKEDYSENSKNDSDQGKRRYRNNVLYAMSEAIGSINPVIRAEVDSWFGKHAEDLRESGKLFTEHTKNGSSIDMISEYTFSNIISKTRSHKLLNTALELSFENKEEKTVSFSLEELLTFKFSPACYERKKEIATFAASRYGLDSNIVDKWSKTKTFAERDEQGSKIYEESYVRNMKAAERLEQSMPGASEKLFKKFGIANFDRYEPEVLLRQLEMENKDVPYGVVVFPEFDYNGAFFQNKDKLEKMRKQLLEGGHEIRIVEAASQFEMAKRLNGFNKKYAPNGNKIEFLILGGHGTKSSVQLGEDKFIDAYMDEIPPPLPNDNMSDEDYQKAVEEWQKNSENEKKYNSKSRDTIFADDLKEGGGRGIRRAANEWLEKNAPIVFVSCSTGAEGGIAQVVGKELGFNAIGPDRPTNIDSIDVKFNDQGRPVFNVEYANVEKFGKAETMKYASKK